MLQKIKQSICFKTIKVIYLTILLLLLNSCLPAIIGISATTLGVVSLQERTINKALDDVTILTQIKYLYLNTYSKDLFANVNIEVIESRVNLTGQVKSDKDRINAVHLAWKVKGVSDVINEIQIEKEKSLFTIIKDIFIEIIIDGKIILNNNFKAVNYSVDVINGTVYLMGISKSQQEVEEIADIISKIKGVKKVVTHIKYLDDNDK